MNYTVGVDTLTLQTNFTNNHQQQEVMYNIIGALLSTYNLQVRYNTNIHKKGLLIHSIYTAGSKILELKSGSYPSGLIKDNKRVILFFISIEFAGLKRYNNKIDEISNNCLKRVVAYLNTNSIRFDISSLDIYVDLFTKINYTYAFCNKKAAGVKYYSVNDRQPYLSTHYIEKFNNTHNRVMKRAYLYDKSFKENNFNCYITWFELLLQSNFFNRHSFIQGVLKKELDRYHILYFLTLKEKRSVLDYYAQYEHTIRRRDLHKLGLDKYRIIPDTKEIEFFLFTLYNIYESDLGLAVKQTNNGFDWF